MEPLENILGQGAPAPAPDVKEQPTPAPQVESQTGTDDQDNVQPEEIGGRKMVPIEALDAAKGRAKRYTEQVASFEKRLEETNAAWERRMAELMQRIPQPQPQPAQQPDWFENPNEAAVHAVAPQIDSLQQMLMHNSRLIAESIHTPQRVTEAEQAFMQAMQSRQLDPADYHRVVNSPNRYAAAVDWHKKKQALAEIGDDPNAFKQKVEAEILAKYGINPDGSNGQQQQQPAPVMPSNLATARNVGNRSGPAWGGPKSLADIFKR